MIIRRSKSTKQLINNIYCHKYSISISKTFANILITHGVDPISKSIFLERNEGHKVDLLKETIKELELINIIDNYDGIIVNSKMHINSNILQHSSNLKIIGMVGFEAGNINYNEATKKGILTMNAINNNTNNAAQLTISLLFTLARKLYQANYKVKHEKVWNKNGLLGIELKGKTLGIIGNKGKIGKMVENIALNMGIKVIGYDKALIENNQMDNMKQTNDINDIYKECDFITVHVPFNNHTNRMVSNGEIALCKDGVIFINCAQGNIIDEEALLRGLNSGKISSAALDVFSKKPFSKLLNELISHKNLICTPNLGKVSIESEKTSAKDLSNQMCDYFDNISYKGISNCSYYSLINNIYIKPFMILSESIGNYHLMPSLLYILLLLILSLYLLYKGSFISETAASDSIKSITINTVGGEPITIISILISILIYILMSILISILISIHISIRISILISIISIANININNYSYIYS
jgi:D-3-phosphoglycerate dehydrogenase